jgi:hypothetical protein
LFLSLTLALPLKSKLQLEAENAVLGHQLLVLTCREAARLRFDIITEAPNNSASRTRRTHATWLLLDGRSASRKRQAARQGVVFHDSRESHLGA